MKKIIIIGYPKSGNTWLSRLTASLVDCPVEGFLYSNHQEIAIEGGGRESEFRLYKSHHQLMELSKQDITSSKIIYVIRDPRDISISGRNYFPFGKLLFPNIKWSKKDLFHKVADFLKAKVNSIHKSLMKKLFAKSEMNKAVLYGNKNVNYWCRVSWKSHVTPYINNSDILKVKYESVISDPLSESKRILNFIGIKREEEKILQDINNQSFEKRKKKFIGENHLGKANFLRKGEREQWKTIFSRKENLWFVDNLKQELIELGYDLEK